MSVKYRNQNGQETIIAGLTPGGDIEAGAVDTRSGTVEIPATTSGTASSVSVTFDTAFDDNNYEVILSFDENSTDFKTLELAVYNKRANGFNINALRNYSTDASAQTIAWKAWKIYSVQHAQQNAEAIADIQAAMPADAGSGNKLVTKSYVDNADSSLGNRISSIEDAVPATASITNKLVTASDLSSVEIDKLEDINDVDVTGIQDGDTIIWDDTNSEWVPGQSGKTYTEGLGIDIDSNDKISVNQTYVPTTFVGSTADWNALSATEKAKYNLVSLNDDSNGISVIDAVADGEMRPVTSNAVYDGLATKANDSRLGTDRTVYDSGNLLYWRKNGICVVAMHGVSASNAITLPSGMRSPGYLTCYGKGNSLFIVNGYNLTYTYDGSNPIYGVITYPAAD